MKGMPPCFLARVSLKSVYEYVVLLEGTIFLALSHLKVGKRW